MTSKTLEDVTDEEVKEGSVYIVCGHVQVVDLFMIDDVVFECHRFSNLFVRICSYQLHDIHQCMCIYIIYLCFILFLITFNIRLFLYKIEKRPLFCFCYLFILFSISTAGCCFPKQTNEWELGG